MRKALFILGDLSDSDLDWLVAVATREELPEGSVLVREGVPAEHVYVLLDGRLSVRVEAHRKKEINVLHPGEFIGELSFLDSRPPSATVVAAADSTVAAISRDELSGKLERDTAFAARFYRALGVFLAHRLRRQTARGAAPGRLDSLSDEVSAEDEIDPELLDSVALAATRFEWFQKRITNQ